MLEAKNTTKGDNEAIKVIELGAVDENNSKKEASTCDQKSSTYSANIFELIKENEKLPPPEFFWGPIQPGSFGFIFGPAKSGKTIFCENLGMAMAARQDSFFGNNIKNSTDYRVLFVSIEEDWRNRTFRNAKQVIHRDYKEADLQNYHAVGDNFPRSFNKVEDFIKAIKADVKKLKPNVIFVDSLTRLVGSDYSKAEIGRKVILPFREFAQNNNLALVMIHHSVKEEAAQRNAPLSIYSMAGSRVFLQEADYIIGIRKTAEGKRYVKELASRYSKEKDTVTTFEINDSLCILMQEVTTENKVLGATERVELVGLKERVKRSIQGRWDSGETMVKKTSLVDEMKTYAGKSRVYEIINELLQERFAEERSKCLMKPRAENSEDSPSN